VALPDGVQSHSPPSVSVDRQQYETFVVELLVDEQGAVRRTRMVHVQTGTEERWAGWDEERLVRFVVTHGDFTLP
jgi:hypothetical protein